MSALARFRLAIMLSLGLSVILGGLGPVVAFNLGLEGSGLWRVFSLLYAAITFLLFIYAGKNFLAVQRLSHGVRLNFAFAALAGAGTPLLFIVFLFNGLGIYIDGSFGVYLAGLVFTLGLSALMFLLLIFRTAESPDGD